MAKTMAHHFTVVSSDHAAHRGARNHSRNTGFRNHLVTDGWRAGWSDSPRYSKHVPVSFRSAAAGIWGSAGDLNVAADWGSCLGANAALQKGRRVVKRQPTKENQPRMDANGREDNDTMQPQMVADRSSKVASVNLGRVICGHQRSSVVCFFSCPFVACPTKHGGLEAGLVCICEVGSIRG